MLLSYVLLLFYSGASSAYELYMGLACLDHDCMSQLLVNVDDASMTEHFMSQHHDTIYRIGVFWKLR